MLSPLSGVLGPLRFARNASSYLLRDEFTTPQAAPLTGARNCEPGPGSLNISDASGVLSMDGGVLVASGTTTSISGITASAPYARTIGRAIRISSPVHTIGGFIRFGWDANAGVSPAIGQGMRWNGDNTSITWFGDSGFALDTTSVLGSGMHEIMSVMRSTGTSLFARSGGVGDWRLIWVYITGSTAMYPRFHIESGRSCNTQFDSLRIVDLAPLDSRFSTDYGLATSRIAGSAGYGVTVAQNADAFIEFTHGDVPASSALQTRLRFRVVDASNYLQVAVNPDGSLVISQTGGTGAGTLYTSAAGVVSLGTRISLVTSGTSIVVYTNVARLTAVTTPHLGTQLLTANGSGNAIQNLTVWPLFITMPDV